MKQTDFKTLNSRWNSGFCKSIFDSLLTNMSEGYDFWDSLHEQLIQIPHSEELDLIKTKNREASRLYDLRGLDLNNRNLSKGLIYYSDVFGINLNKSLLNDFTMNSCEMRQAVANELVGTNILLSGLKVVSSSIAKGRFKNSKFEGFFVDVDFSYSLFEKCFLNFISPSYNINLAKCNFDKTELIISKSWGNVEPFMDERDKSYLNFEKSTFQNESTIHLVGKWRNIRFDEASMVRMNLSRNRIQGANPLQNASFIKANLTKADFTEVDLTGANFEGANLEGTNFTNAILENANFTGANLKDTIFTDAKTEGAIGLD